MKKILLVYILFLSFNILAQNSVDLSAVTITGVDESLSIVEASQIGQDFEFVIKNATNRVYYIEIVLYDSDFNEYSTSLVSPINRIRKVLIPNLNSRYLREVHIKKNTRDNYPSSTYSVKYLVENGKLRELIRKSMDGTDLTFNNNPEGLTYLHIAAEKGYLNMVKFLVQSGFDLNAKDDNGNTPIHVAAQYGKLDIVKYLVQYRADLHINNSFGESPLDWAAHYGELDVVKYLVESGGDFKEKNNKNWTALFSAVVSGNLDVVMYLVKVGSDVKAIGENGKTVLHWAAINDANVDMMKFLVDAGADLKAKDDNGDTVLHWAARTENFEVVRFLVQSGVNANEKSKDGRTAIDHAKKYKYSEVVRYLRSIRVKE